MATKLLLLLALSLSLFASVAVGRQPSPYQLTQSQQCRLQRLSSSQPSQRIKSEGGITELWNENEDQFQCAGVAPMRNTLRPNALSLPNYHPAPRLVYIEQGEGLLGVTFPGCAETFQSEKSQEGRGEEEQEEGGSSRRDYHQKIRRIRRGDIIALPSGVNHWCYNDGNEDLIAVSINDLNHQSNQLDQKLRAYYLAGGAPRRGQQGLRSQEARETFNSVMDGFDPQLLAEAMNVPEELVRRMQNQNERGLIVIAQEGMSMIRPDEREEQGEYGFRSNGFEETFCTMRLHQNIDERREADIYSKQAGRINIINQHKLPILRYLDMSAERGNLYPNALYTPHWTIILQMTEQQVHTWSLDANQYVADEDDNTYSCRISGALLLEEVINSCGIEAIDAIIDAAKNRFAESQQAKVAGSAAWWRMREATLYGLASLSDQLLEAEVSQHTRTNLGNLFEQIIAEDVGTGVHEYPFLFARVFSSVAKFSSVISRGVVEHFLYAAIKAIGMDVPPPVKVGACRALSQLLPDANKGMLQPLIMGLFSSLADLLNQASDETMHLVLETLQAAIKADDEAPTSIEPIISPIILNLWASHVSDPFISIDAVEVLEAIKNAPGCIQPLVSRVLPYIGPILNKPQRQPDGLVAGALDLLTMLLKNSPSDVVKAVYETCFDSVIRIVLQTDDHSEMQNATECLASLLSVGKKEVLAWGGNPGFTMKSLLDVASRLLDPDLESSGSLFVGSYILQLILHLPSQMAPHIRDLVAALVRRMQSSKIAGLRSSLILIFARLVHMSAPHVEQFIDLLISVPAEGHSNSFVYVMSEWTKQQGEIQGSYEIKVTTTALALLLSTRHIELWKINVQGHLIKSTTGITTRSKAKLAPDQWSSMLLPAKILALLADVLIEIQEQVLGGDDEDSEWEEVQGDLEADQDLLHSAAATSYTRPSYEYLDAMAKALNEDKDDGDEDELLSDADPLNEINLANYLFDFFVKFSQSDRPLFDHLCQSLTKPQQNAVLMVLNR